VSWYPGSRGQAAAIGGRGIAREEQSSGCLLPLEEQGVTWETLPPGCRCDTGLTPEEVREGVTIATGCIIGAGALVTRNTRPGGVYLAPASELLPGSSAELSALLEAR
jgi:hypothetical protein